MISSEQGGRREGDGRLVALIMAVAPAALMTIFAAALLALYLGLLDVNREVGVLTERLDQFQQRVDERFDTVDRRLTRLEESQAVLLRRLETIERAATPRDRMARE